MGEKRTEQTLVLFLSPDRTSLLFFATVKSNVRKTSEQFPNWPLNPFLINIKVSESLFYSDTFTPYFVLCCCSQRLPLALLFSRRVGRPSGRHPNAAASVASVSLPPARRHAAAVTLPLDRPLSQDVTGQRLGARLTKRLAVATQAASQDRGGLAHVGPNGGLTVPAPKADDGRLKAPSTSEGPDLPASKARPRPVGLVQRPLACLVPSRQTGQHPSLPFCASLPAPLNARVAVA